MSGRSRPYFTHPGEAALSELSDWPVGDTITVSCPAMPNVPAHRAASVDRPSPENLTHLDHADSLNATAADLHALE